MFRLSLRLLIKLWSAGHYTVYWLNIATFSAICYLRPQFDN